VNKDNVIPFKNKRAEENDVQKFLELYAASMKDAAMKGRPTTIIMLECFREGDDLVSRAQAHGGELSDLEIVGILQHHKFKLELCMVAQENE